jgi:DNA gyrase/topoisomerase IV subunit B
MSDSMNTTVATTVDYGADSIQVLEGLEAVRKRPGMYIGDTTIRGYHHLVYEIADNAVDEHLAGYCKNIYITIRTDGSLSVDDNGRGVPVSDHTDQVKMPWKSFTRFFMLVVSSKAAHTKYLAVSMVLVLRL